MTDDNPTPGQNDAPGSNPPAPAPAPAPAGGATPPAPAPAPAPAAPPAPAAAPADADVTAALTALGASPDGKPWTVQSLYGALQDARNEAAGKRSDANRKRSEALRAIASELGVEIPGDEPTVESLTSELTTQRTEAEKVRATADAAEQRALIAEAALREGIPADRLDYLRWKIDNDPVVASARGKDGFGATLTSAIATLKGSDPMLAGTAGGGSGPSGAESFGGADGTTAVTQEQFDAMGYDDRLALYRSKPEDYKRLAAG